MDAQPAEQHGPANGVDGVPEFEFLVGPELWCVCADPGWVEISSRAANE